jgi:hypothetical protein
MVHELYHSVKIKPYLFPLTHQRHPEHHCPWPPNETAKQGAGGLASGETLSTHSQGRPTSLAARA